MTHCFPKVKPHFECQPSQGLGAMPLISRVCEASSWPAPLACVPRALALTCISRVHSMLREVILRCLLSDSGEVGLHPFPTQGCPRGHGLVTGIWSDIIPGLAAKWASSWEAPSWLRRVSQTGTCAETPCVSL